MTVKFRERILVCNIVNSEDLEKKYVVRNLTEFRKQIFGKKHEQSSENMYFAKKT